MSEFKGQIVLITGAARGIGKSIAKRFALAGAHVIIADINEVEGDKSAEQITNEGYTAEFLKIDLAKIASVEAGIQHCFDQYGHLDVLVNNARGGQRTLPLKETEANWQVAFDISLKAPLFAGQKYVELLGDKLPGGCILNISSVAAQSICHESASYHLSKSALENLTRYLAVHAGDKGIRVNGIRPGFIVQDEHQTRYWKDDNTSYRKTAEFCHPLKRIGSSGDVADAALFLCSKQASFITGQILTVDGGLTIQDPWELTYRFQQEFS
jgi:NAD(P)-dependent dehydrogenase (short-subunit alcohol dehydrogenase family)